MSAPRRPAVLAGAVVLALTLASCTGGSDPSPEPTSQDGTAAPSPEARADVGPVEALQLELIGDVDEEAWARVEHDLMEDAIAQCMRAAGFEYTPEPYEPFEDEGDTDTIEYAREFGYGATTLDDDWDEDDYEPTPNDLYLAELSDEELDAYWLAFEGEFEDFDDDEIDLEDFEDEDGEIDLGELDLGDEADLDELDDGLDLDDFETGGCQGEAQQALMDNPLPYDFPEHQDVLIALDELYGEVLSDERIIEAEEAWSQCMADEGFADLMTSEDAEDLVYDAYDAAWDDVPDDADDLSEEQLAAVQELEIAIATTDFECRESSGLTELTREIQFAAEAEFVEEHRDALTAFFTDMGAALEG